MGLQNNLKIGECVPIVTRIQMNAKQLRHPSKTWRGGMILLMFATLVAGCGQNNAQTISTNTTDFSFTPNVWNVRVGERVTLRMMNESNTEHEWVLLQQGAQVTMPFDADDEARIAFESEVEPGSAKVSFFTAPAQAGTYRIVCGLPGHLEQGMEGTLIVQ